MAIHLVQVLAGVKGQEIFSIALLNPPGVSDGRGKRNVKAYAVELIRVKNLIMGQCGGWYGHL